MPSSAHASEIILHAARACSNSVAFAGFDGATFTNAPNTGVIFVALSHSKSASSKGSTSSRHPGRSAPAAGAAQRSFRVRPRTAVGSGHRHRRRLQGLRAGQGRPRAAGAREAQPGRIAGTAGTEAGFQPGLHAFQHAHAADLCRHRPHEGRAARRADQPRLRDAVRLHGLGLRQRLQYPRPHLPRDRASRQPVTACPCATSRT